VAAKHVLDIYPHTGERSCLGCVDVPAADAPETDADADAGDATGPATAPARAAAGGGPDGVPEPARPEDHLVAVEIAGAGGAPRADEPWILELPDGGARSGRTDAAGFVRQSVAPHAAGVRLRLPDRDTTAPPVAGAPAGPDAYVPGGVDVPVGTPARVVLPARITRARLGGLLFASGESAILPSAAPALAALAALASAEGARTLVLVGHADTAGAAAYNRTLSGERARALADALVAGGALPDGLAILTHGCGEAHPEIPTDDGVAEPRNRRVEAFLFEGPAEPPPPDACPAAGCSERGAWVAQLERTVDIDDEPAALLVHVRDASGNAVPDASVRLAGSARPGARAGADGDALVGDLPPGTYTAVVELDGYRTATVEATLPPGAPAPVEIDAVLRRAGCDTLTLPGGCFPFDSSFPGPGVAEFLGHARAAAASDRARPLGVFGHADATGDLAHNKVLSDRRAKAVYALLTGDLALFDEVAEAEGWPLACYQAMLRGLGCNPGAIDGETGALTDAAVAAFQHEYGRDVYHRDGPARAHPPLDATGTLDDATRAALRDAYVAYHSVRLPADRFLGPRCSGCSELNPVSDTGRENRRVTIAIWGSEAPDAGAFPCVEGDVSACPSEGGACKFYRAHVGDQPLPADMIIPFYDFEWIRTPTGNVHLSALTPLADTNDVRISVFRCTDEPPAEMDSSEGGPRPAPGEKLAELPGLVRSGVAYALWTPPPCLDPDDVATWYLDGDDAPEGAHEGAWAPPVFLVESGPYWALSGPPGLRADRVDVDGEGDAPVIALRNDGTIVFAPNATALPVTSTHTRWAALLVPGRLTARTETSDA